MVSTRSKVKMNMPKLRELTNAQITALEHTAKAVRTDVDQAQVTPFVTGRTQNEGSFVDYSQSGSGKVTLTYMGPYARRIYYHPEYDFKKDENPNAQGLWLEAWQAGGSRDQFAITAYKKLYRCLGGV